MKRWRSANQLVGVACGFAILLSCEGNPTSVNRENQMMRTLEHPNGLTLAVGEHESVTKTEAGYTVKPAHAAEMRSPTEVTIALQAGVQPPAGSCPKSKRVHGRELMYRVEAEAGGGSAGDQYTMTAWIACSAAQHVVARQSVAAETEQEANFGYAFEILATAKCRGDSPADSKH